MATSAGIDGGRDLLGEVGVVGDDRAAGRAAEGLVGGERDEVGALAQRVLEAALGDQARDVRGVVEQRDAVAAHDLGDRGQPVREEHQARADDDQPRDLPAEERVERVDVDVQRLGVVGQRRDPQPAHARDAHGVVAEMPAGPVGQHRDRVARLGQRRVDGEVGERRARSGAPRRRRRPSAARSRRRR